MLLSQTVCLIYILSFQTKIKQLLKFTRTYFTHACVMFNKWFISKIEALDLLKFIILPPQTKFWSKQKSPCLFALPFVCVIVSSLYHSYGRTLEVPTSNKYCLWHKVCHDFDSGHLCKFKLTGLERVKFVSSLYFIEKHWEFLL